MKKPICVTPNDEFLRNNSIGFLRLILASLVVLYHSFVLAGQVPPGHMYAKLAVSGFFFLSGILVTQSFTRCSSVWDYFWRRNLRIFPAYWCCLFISAFLIAPIGLWLQHRDLGLGASARYVASAFLLYHHPTSVSEVFRTTPYGDVMNGSLWTLPLEYTCYIAVGFGGVLGLLRRQWLLYVVALLFYLWQVFPGTRLPVIPHTPKMFHDANIIEPLLMFLIGAIAFGHRERIKIPGYVGAFSAATILFLFAFEIPDPGFQTLSAAIRPFALGAALIWLAAVLPMKDWDKKHGDLSYGTYIYSFPIQQLLIVSGVVGGWSLFALSYPLTLALAFVSWRLIEKPALSLKRAFKKKPAAPAQQPPAPAAEEILAPEPG